MNKDSVTKDVETFIVNKLGINLVSVKSIEVNRQEDGQLTSIVVKFIPSNSNKEINNE